MCCSLRKKCIEQILRTTSSMRTYFNKKKKKRIKLGIVAYGWLNGKRKEMRGKNTEKGDFHTLFLELWKDPGRNEKPEKNWAENQNDQWVYIIWTFYFKSALWYCKINQIKCFIGGEWEGQMQSCHLLTFIWRFHLWTPRIWNEAHCNSQTPKDTWKEPIWVMHYISSVLN